MTQYFKIEYSNGETYLVAREYYAKDRADYYASNDSTRGTEEFNRIFQSEYEVGMDSDEIIDDWIRNNTDWKDVKSIARKLPNSDVYVDYQDEYVNGNHEFVDME